MNSRCKAAGATTEPGGGKGGIPKTQCQTQSTYCAPSETQLNDGSQAGVGNDRDWDVAVGECLSLGLGSLCVDATTPGGEDSGTEGGAPASGDNIDDLANIANAFLDALEQAETSIAKDSAIPKGFANERDFEGFASKLKRGLADAGYGDTEAAFQESSVTGVKFTTGAPFDADRVSDYVIALAGSDIFDAAREAGIPLRGGGMRTGPLTPADVEELGLSSLQVALSESAERPVNFMIYSSLENAVARGPSIVVP
jgi:hypothetical protein